MTEIENVRVVIRVKPIKKELIPNQVIDIDSSGTVITVKKNQSTDPPKTYKFDHIFSQNASQTDVYCHTARPIVEKIFEGYNGTVLAYGQTGTGKTYTMTGNKGKDCGGIIPNTFSHIFSHIAKAKEEFTFLIHVTYLEIYNELVRDLLSKKPSENLEVREHSNIGVFVQDLSGYVVHTFEELENLMRIGEKNRSVGATDINLASSRSHTIFTITFESSNKIMENGKGKGVTRGKLHLVDLAGSERQSKTHATGIRFREASKINQSLSVLGNVISALVDGKSTHIPYRNSKLTRLLQDSLGGNSKTVMIATISPLDVDYEETISTLRYANRAKNIQNRTFVNEPPEDTMLKQFQNEIIALRAQLEKHNTETDSLPESPVNSAQNKEKRKSAKKTNTSSPETTNTEENISEKLLEKNDEIQKTNEENITDKLLEKNDEIQKTKSEQMRLQSKLQQLTDKIIVGGVNLLEKAQNQEFLLEMAASELEQSMKVQEELEQTLQQKEAERIDFEERYSSLQEEAVGKTKKLKKLTTLIMQTKTELADLHQEHQREMEGILDTVRGLTREIQLAELIINSYIPREYQVMIERYIHWNEDIGEYQLKCVAYTGNNMRKRQTDIQDVPEKEYVPKSTVYRQYSATVRKSKSRLSSVPRPTRQH